MRYLIDTNIFVYMASDPEYLSRDVDAIIKEPETVLCISAESLPLKKEHMHMYARMQVNEAQGHKDPSDHVIIAHAMTEHLPLISSDTRFEFYRKQGRLSFPKNIYIFFPEHVHVFPKTRTSFFISSFEP